MCVRQAKLIKKLIGHKEGLKSLSVNVVGRLAIVKHDPAKLPLQAPRLIPPPSPGQGPVTDTPPSG